MKNSKKWSLLVLCMAFLLIFASACGSASSNGDGKPANNEPGGAAAGEGNKAEASKPVKLKVLQFWPEHEAQMKETFDKFTQANPGIEVEMTTVTWDTVENTLKTKIASNDRPDLAFGWPGGYTQQFVDQGEVMELTGKLAGDSEWKQSILPFPLNFGTTSEGKIYNIPFRGSFFTAFYNKDLLDQQGLGVPGNVKELEQLFESLKSKGILPMASSGTPSLPDYFINYLRVNGVKQAGGDLNGYSKGQTPWNDANAVAALDTFKSWFAKGYFDKNLLTTTREQAQQQFYDGKAAILMANNNELNTIKDAVSFKLGEFPLPLDNGEKYAFGNMDGFFVMQKTEHPEETLKLAKFLNSAEAQTLWAKETGSAMTNPEANKEIADPFLAATAAEIQYVNPLNEYDFYVEYTDQSWKTQLIDKLQGLLLSKFSAQEVADWQQKQKESFMKK